MASSASGVVPMTPRSSPPIATWRAGSIRTSPGEVATRRMSRINAAFGRIRDADARTAYDAALTADGIAVPDPARRRRQARPPRVIATARPVATAGPRSATAPAGPVRRRVARPEPSCRSGATSTGRSARSPGSTPATSRGWRIGARAGPISTEIDRTLRRVGYRAEPGPTPAAERAKGRRRWSR